MPIGTDRTRQTGFCAHVARWRAASLFSGPARPVAALFPWLLDGSFSPTRKCLFAPMAGLSGLLIPCATAEASALPVSYAARI